MVSAVEKVSGKRVSYAVVPRRAGDVASVFCNPSKASALLGWEAERSVERAIADAWTFETVTRSAVVGS